jgi:predicted MFS family arabinose efflux permease
LAFGCLYTLLATVPVMAEDAGGSAGAGLATGTLMGTTVAAQALMPWLLRRIAARTLFVIGLVVLGGPSPLYRYADDIGVILAVTGVRGIGFGIVVVMAAMLVSLFAEPHRRGRSLGIYGFSTALVGVVGPPLGLALHRGGHDDLLFIGSGCLAVAGGALAAVQLPARDIAGPPAGALRAVVSERRIAAPLLALLPASMVFGAVYSFLVLLRPDSATRALLGFGVALTLGRLWGGTKADSVAPSLLATPAMVMSALGALVVALFGQDVVVIAASTALGAGVGVVGSATLADVMQRAGTARYAAGSAAWNMCFDLGAALGSAGLAVIAASSLSAPFVVVASTIAVAGGLAWVLAWAPSAVSGATARESR